MSLHPQELEEEYSSEDDLILLDEEDIKIEVAQVMLELSRVIVLPDLKEG